MPHRPRSHPLRATITATLVATIAIVAHTTPAHAAAGTAFVRVNQLGYSSPTKRAYLMSSAAETGATFAVKNSGGTTVYTRRDRREPRFVEFRATRTSTRSTSTRVTAAGTYTIAVTGPIAATSPSLPGRHRPERVRRRRWPTRSRSTRTSATARTTSHPRCAPRPGTSTTPPR